MGRTLPYTLCRRLIATRREARLSQLDLADRLGVDRSTVVRWESGRIAPKRKDVTAWALATGYDAEWLWTGHVAPEPSPQDMVPNIQRYSRPMDGKAA